MSNLIINIKLFLKVSNAPLQRDKTLQIKLSQKKKKIKI